MQQYDKRLFTQSGLRHHDLYFPDGTCPPDAILSEFLSIAESERGALAIHCKAGLGRTGTLIGCYLMKHYGFTAPEVRTLRLITLITSPYLPLSRCRLRCTCNPGSAV